VEAVQEVVEYRLVSSLKSITVVMRHAVTNMYLSVEEVEVEMVLTVLHQLYNVSLGRCASPMFWQEGPF
jgi:hypothetical protein